MKDLIERQAAIDAIRIGITCCKLLNKETGEVTELFKSENQELEKAIARVKEIPSCAESDVVSRNAIIQKLNTMDRYIADELTLCDTDKKFPRNEVFIVDDVYEEISEQLPSAQQEWRWIPCTERLPEKDGWYLTTYDGEICNREGEVFTGMSEFENGKWEEDTVYAWMPLPEPWRKL